MSRRRPILLIGECGAGKTWVMRQIKERRRLNVKAKLGKFIFHKSEEIALLGNYNGSKFEGSDKLSMSVNTDLNKLKRLQDLGLILLAEGDRFMNRPFIEAYQPRIIKITDDGSEGRSRRKTSQTQRQIKAIRTRVSNIEAHYTVRDSNEALELITKLIDEEIRPNTPEA